MDPLVLAIIVILVLWLAGWGLHFGGSLIHLLLVLLIIIVIVRLIQGRSV